MLPAHCCDPEQAGAVSQIGYDQIRHRLSSIPGRSLQDLVNSQPGWLYEGNAGSCIPGARSIKRNLSWTAFLLRIIAPPASAPRFTADDVQSMSIYTAGMPAEYGRKMGGVVEVNTHPGCRSMGLHGLKWCFPAEASILPAPLQPKRSTRGAGIRLGAPPAAAMTDHYLNPVVPQNYSNTGTLGDFSGRYQRDLDGERSAEHERSP